jgi:hypothetical protein
LILLLTLGVGALDSHQEEKEGPAGQAKRCNNARLKPDEDNGYTAGYELQACTSNYKAQGLLKYKTGSR